MLFRWFFFQDLSFQPIESFVKRLGMAKRFAGSFVFMFLTYKLDFGIYQPFMFLFFTMFSHVNIERARIRDMIAIFPGASLPLGP